VPSRSKALSQVLYDLVSAKSRDDPYIMTMYFVEAANGSESQPQRY